MVVGSRLISGAAFRVAVPTVRRAAAGVAGTIRPGQRAPALRAPEVKREARTVKNSRSTLIPPDLRQERYIGYFLRIYLEIFARIVSGYRDGLCCYHLWHHKL